MLERYTLVEFCIAAAIKFCRCRWDKVDVDLLRNYNKVKARHLSRGEVLETMEAKIYYKVKQLKYDFKD